MVEEKSCGCIIIENQKVLLIQQLEGFWGFPKGHIEENETDIQTAIREVKEETNLDVKIISTKTYESKYIINNEINKTVVYFVAKPISSDIKMQESEISNIKWFDFDEALETITYDDNKNILREVLKNL